jgi:hypothetical protein
MGNYYCLILNVNGTYSCRGLERIGAQGYSKLHSEERGALVDAAEQQQQQQSANASSGTTCEVTDPKASCKVFRSSKLNVVSVMLFVMVFSPEGLRGTRKSLIRLVDRAPSKSYY